MNEVKRPRPNGSQTEKLVYFPRADGSRIPYRGYSSRRRCCARGSAARGRRQRRWLARLVNDFPYVGRKQWRRLQRQNSLAVRQILPNGPTNFELIFYFFGYTDDTPGEMLRGVGMRLHDIGVRLGQPDRRPGSPLLRPLRHQDYARVYDGSG